MDVSAEGSSCVSTSDTILIQGVQKGFQVILKTTSHRSRSKLDGILGSHPQYYFTFEQGGCFVRVDDPELIARALIIKGVTKCRNQDEEHYHKCWETGIAR